MQNAEHKQSVTWNENATGSSYMIDNEIDLLLAPIFGGIIRNDDVRRRRRAFHERNTEVFKSEASSLHILLRLEMEMGMKFEVWVLMQNEGVLIRT